MNSHGDGIERENLMALVKQESLEGRITFLGNVPHEKLGDYYGAVDILVLASSREGWANVLLESMACGTPVVATRVWGTPEIISCTEAGILVERTPESIAQGINKLLERYPDRELTRLYAEQFRWDEISLGQRKIFDKVV